MDFTAGDAVDLSGSAVPDHWSAADQNLWATDDDYRSFTLTPKFSSGTTAPDISPAKKSKNSQKSSKSMGKMFFKTKLCGKFRAGVCPYITNCNFAHGMEELRRPPPNWQEIVAAQHNYDEAEPLPPSPPQREEHQIPILSLSEMRCGESQRSYKGRHCKKFYTEEGCPYGDSCTFLHDEQSRARESVAISLSPTVGGGGYGSSGANGPNQKPSNWKTRICNKWETTGSCPFGNKCHFAHGVAELHKYGGGLVEEGGDSSSSVPPEPKQQGGGPPKATTDTMVAPALSAPATDVFHMGVGVPSQRPSVVAPKPGQRPLQKWKGPDKISKIYGDWIDDLE